MIQTGSYVFAKQLYNSAPPDVKRRMLLYNGSKEKSVCIKIHEISNDTILVGPTLNEGIDLPGDKCRFIIIMKVPGKVNGKNPVKHP
jgi:Rad3-related DNA helicase